jgi:hypothetical protein
MTRRAKVELFEEIRREYELGVGTINGVARFHRRMVGQALANAQPPGHVPQQRGAAEAAKPTRLPPASGA